MAKSRRTNKSATYQVNPKKITDLLKPGWGLLLRHTLLDEDVVRLNVEALLQKMVFRQKAPIYLTEQSYAFCNFGEIATFFPQQHLVWVPANKIAVKMMRILEAVRDLTLAMQEPETSKITLRLLKSWSTPLLNWFQAINAIYDDINGNPKRYGILKSDMWKIFQKMLKQKEIDICAHITPNGHLVLVRDKMHSHIDKEMLETPGLYWQKIDFNIFIEYIASAVAHTFFLQCLDGVYAWKLERGTSEVISLTTEEFILLNFFVESDGSVTSETDIILSLKHNLLNEEIPLIKKYNKYVELSGLTNEWYFGISSHNGISYNITMPRPRRSREKHTRPSAEETHESA